MAVEFILAASLSQHDDASESACQYERALINIFCYDSKLKTILTALVHMYMLASKVFTYLYGIL
ncbi:hypothetical protein NUACC26_046830 [Scytonema sp. NUACC26]